MLLMVEDNDRANFIHHWPGRLLHITPYLPASALHAPVIGFDIPYVIRHKIQ